MVTSKGKLAVTLRMVLDYWWLSLQRLTLVAICSFGHRDFSIGKDGFGIGEGGGDGDISRG